ncbi:MAG: endolytic transglycosylase MltG [Polyangiaceae bacterium]|nr:endolytic transglycosylase MltG [Polyangiaceae bacterium]MCE7891297.1 endolytic transglycosylase MltG [Sorangiineae bacterium PRO1]MCL4748755.1 endolytic transglycosylase MltG [Myxococcales bacterium]
MSKRAPRPRAPRRAPKKAKARSKSTRALASGIGIGLAVLVLPLLALFGWALLPGAGEGRRLLVDWPADLNASAAGERLARAGLVQSPRLFAWYLRVFSDAAELEPGAHVLNDGLGARQLAQRLTRARSRPERKVTVPEGWNHAQLARRLEEQEICAEAAFRKAVMDAGLRRELGVSGESVEGLLFPATYELGVDSAPAEVIRTLVRTFRKRFEALAEKHPGAREELRQRRGWGEHEIVTLASIVEREAVVEDERPVIASVYLNRLDDPEHRPEKMLQADPTAAYGCVIEPERAPSCAGFDGKVTPALLRDAQNRYNTYKHPGLPPGPIASPGEASLRAVLAPAKTEFLFFVAAGNGRHRFSRSFADHNRAIEESR